MIENIYHVVKNLMLRKMGKQHHILGLSMTFANLSIALSLYLQYGLLAESPIWKALGIFGLIVMVFLFSLTGFLSFLGFMGKKWVKRGLYVGGFTIGCWAILSFIWTLTRPESSTSWASTFFLAHVSIMKFVIANYMFAEDELINQLENITQAVRSDRDDDDIARNELS